MESFRSSAIGGFRFLNRFHHSRLGEPDELNDSGCAVSQRFGCGDHGIHVDSDDAAHADRSKLRLAAHQDIPRLPALIGLRLEFDESASFQAWLAVIILAFD
jgi:hypothetical protein